MNKLVRSLVVRITFDQMRKPLQVLLRHHLLLFRHYLRLVQHQIHACQMPSQLNFVVLNPLRKLLNSQTEQGSIDVFHCREQKIASADMRIQDLARIPFPQADYLEIECGYDFPIDGFPYRSRDGTGEWAKGCWIEITPANHDRAPVRIRIMALVYFFAGVL